MTDAADTTAIRAHLEAVLTEERALVFPSFTAADALRLGDILYALATERALSVELDIRRNAQVAFHAAFPGTTPENADWIRRKVNVVHRHETSSLAFRLRCDLGGAPIWLDRIEFAPAGGCIPVKLAGGEIVGTVTVSGLKDVDDHALVVEAMQAFLE